MQQANEQRQPDSPAGMASSDIPRIIVATLVVAGVLLSFGLLIRLRQVAAALFLSLLLATLFTPIVDWLQQRGMRRSVGAFVVVGGLISGFGVLLWRLFPVVLNQILVLRGQLPLFISDLQARMMISDYRIVRQFARQVVAADVGGPSLGEQISLYVGANAELLLKGGLSFLLAPLFIYFWLVYRTQILKSLLLLAPIDSREPLLDTWTQIEQKVGAFLRAQLTLAIVVALCSLIGYWIFGIPYALLLALIAGVMELVPVIGPVVATAAAVIATLSVDPELAWRALLIGVVVQVLENNILVPRIMKQSLGLGPIVTLLALSGLTALFGPAGLIVAIPLASVLVVVISEAVRRYNEQRAKQHVDGRGRIDRLRYQLFGIAADIQRLLLRRNTALRNSDQLEELESIISSLDRALRREAKDNR